MLFDSGVFLKVTFLQETKHKDISNSLFNWALILHLSAMQKLEYSEGFLSFLVAIICSIQRKTKLRYTRASGYKDKRLLNFDQKLE